MSPPPPSSPPGWSRWAAAAVVVVAVCLRFHGLADQSLWLDELWGLEVAAGHGTEHQTVPVGRLLPAQPDLTGLAGPAWRVWGRLDRVTHPPLGYLPLRLWVDLFGPTEASVRSLSAACSAGAVVLLMLAVRTAAGWEPALWAGGLMAVAGPQVRAAQDARPYAQLMLLGTAALLVVARTLAAGPTRRRSAALAAVVLALLLSHYFAVFAVGAVGVYAVVATRGATRRHLLAAVLIAGGAFAVAWGPFMLRQVAAFSPADRAAAFLHEAGPGHAAATGWRVLTLPASLLVDARPIPRWYGFIGLAAWAAVLLPRRLPTVWPLWGVVPIGLLATLDLTRSTAHLEYLRYALLATPAVVAAVAVLPTSHRTAGRAVAAAVVVWGAWSLPVAYRPDNADFRALGETMRASVRPGELVVFAGPARTFAPQILCLAASYYAGPVDHPVMLLEAPASPDQRRQIGTRPTVWLVADPTVTLARQWLPGYHLAAGQSWPVVGSLLRMEPDGK